MPNCANSGFEGKDCAFILLHPPCQAHTGHPVVSSQGLNGAGSGNSCSRYTGRDWETAKCSAIGMGNEDLKILYLPSS